MNPQTENQEQNGTETVADPAAESLIEEVSIDGMCGVY